MGGPAAHVEVSERDAARGQAQALLLGGAAAFVREGDVVRLTQHRLVVAARGEEISSSPLISAVIVP